MRTWRREAALDLYNLVLAAVLLVSPWLFTLTNPTGKFDLWASAVAIIAISLSAILAFAKWEEWANLVLGLWLVSSPWILGFADTRAMHFSIAIGMAVTFLAALELFLLYDADQPHQSGKTTPGPN
jgi:SPW repeat